MVVVSESRALGAGLDSDDLARVFYQQSSEDAQARSILSCSKVERFLCGIRGAPVSNDFWETAAQRDPLWAILSDPAKKGRRWTPAEFFATGRREITLLMYQLRQLGHVPASGRALDFGCGVGRLSQALGIFFAEVIGVDVSPTMLRLAAQANRTPDRVRYVLNQSDDLQQFSSKSFDFIYSDIVLQHVAPVAARQFIAEFLRVAKRGGIVVFQIPSHRRPAQEHSSPRHMDDAAYRAQLDVRGLPSSLGVGERADVLVALQNVSQITWDQSLVGPLRVGNHWLSESGEMLVQDDGRTLLSTMVRPQMPMQASVSVQAPGEPGRFICEFDVVHEGISWFADKGSRSFRQVVDVIDDGVVSPNVPTASDMEQVAAMPHVDLELPPADNLELGEFPMDGVHRDAVLELIGEGGGRVFHMEADERGGPEWYGYRYYVIMSGLS
jgi:SAM-dependent methyltransferase